MKSAVLAVISAAFFMIVSGSGVALAGDGQPGSCLVFPYYNTHPANMTIIRITNVSQDTVQVKLDFVDEVSCSPNDYLFNLTGGDTITFLDSWLNPSPSRGFMFAHIVETNGPVQNVLVGQELVFGSNMNMPLNFSVNAWAFRALDVEPDGKIHLDGVEYECAPKSLHFPGFLGQNFPNKINPIVESWLVLINLTGGKYFDHSANVLVYNDDEQVFSSHVTFPCFAFISLDSMSLATDNKFLLASNHHQDEPLGFASLGLETGWLSITGDTAENPDHGIIFENASLIGFLLERIGSTLQVVDLPFHVEDPATHNNGLLWSTSTTGH